MRLINLVGQQFGRLTVTKRVGTQNSKPRWLCSCMCGGTTTACGNNLKRGFVTSCGCYRREFRRGNQLPDGESGFNTLFYDYSRRAQEKGFVFRLSRKEFKSLTQGNCFYCGKVPAQLGFPNHKIRVPYLYNGIDRKNSSVGYISENCVSACSVCNYMKLEMSVEEFIRVCESIVAHRKMMSGAALETAPSSRSEF